MKWHQPRLWLIAATLGTGLIGLPASACEDNAAGQSVAQPPFIAKTNWRIAGARCPAGCSKDMRAFLHKLEGQPVTLADNAFTAPFADSCDGQVSVQLSRVKAQDVVARVNAGLPPSRAKLTATNLGLQGSVQRSGPVNCRHDGQDSPLATLLSVEPGRVLVLFEEQSVIELR